jgi:hypothetical protein
MFQADMLLNDPGKTVPMKQWRLSDDIVGRLPEEIREDVSIYLSPAEKILKLLHLLKLLKMLKIKEGIYGFC